MSVETSISKTDGYSRRRFVQLCIAFIVAALVIRTAFNTDRAFEDFDLGSDTKTTLATRNGKPCHFNDLDSDQFTLVKKDIDEAKLPLVLFLGNSQTTGVNLRPKNAKNYLQMLSEPLIDRAFLLGHTLPNCNLQEQLAIVKFWTQNTTPKLLVLPLFYDDLREDGIRELYFQFLSKKIDCSQSMDHICKQLQAIRDAKIDSEQDSESTKSSRVPTLQEKCESFINQKLDSNSIIWKNRSNVRGDLFVFLYQLRNTVFQISPQTKRKMISANEQTNLRALDDIIAVASNKKIAILAYIPPLRQDVDPPYDMDAYRAFKLTMQEKFKNDNFQFVDIDRIVPGELWGMKNSTNLSGTPEYDFMHFQQEGHRLLADALLPVLSEMIDKL